MMESKGQSILSGNLKEAKPVELVAGQDLTILIDPAVEGDKDKIACNYKSLPDTVIIGSTICISIEQDLTKWVMLEVLDITEVSHKPVSQLSKSTRFVPLSIDRGQVHCQGRRSHHREGIHQTPRLQR